LYILCIWVAPPCALFIIFTLLKKKYLHWMPDLSFKQDSENDHIYHSELFTLTKRMARGQPQKLSFTVPIFEPHPPQYYIRAVSDSWLHAEAFYTISFHNLALPEVFISYFLNLGYSQIITVMETCSCQSYVSYKDCFIQAGTSHTELLDLKPLPLTSLGNSTYEALYKFSHFNPIQTQVWFRNDTASFLSFFLF
jgi:activating signal cointegrator complex subunit 3